MCGIVGALNWGGREALERATDAPAPPGPDDRGTWEALGREGGWVGLGSRRLAILDLSPAGHMPMSTPDGKLTIVYNGECYNHIELRRELEQRGHSFRSTSDTETLLHAYREYGPEFVKRVNGIFALAIWDEAQQSLYLARDHFGVKPLYFSRQDKRFAFASEIKAFLQLPDFHPRFSFPALHRFLTFLWVPEPDTILENVKKLPAAHYAVLRNGELSVTRYWDLRFPDAGTTYTGNEADLVYDVRQLFMKSVKRQLLSDVPLGAFLSAGMDSSSIVSAMSFVNEGPVRTFTIAFPEKYRRGEVTVDDPAVARRTAEAFGCRHQEI